MSFASPPWRVVQLVERLVVNRVVASPSLAMPVTTSSVLLHVALLMIKRIIRFNGNLSSILPNMGIDKR